MDDREAFAAVVRLMNTIPNAAPPPLATLMRQGRIAKRRRRLSRVAVVGGACLVLVGFAGWADIRPTSTSDDDVPPTRGGQLTQQQYSVAVAVARAEAKKYALSVSSATATTTEGTEVGNLSQPCTSGTLLVITMIGSFHGIAIAGTPTAPSDPPFEDTVTAIRVTADPDSGMPCLLGVRTGSVQPDPTATELVLD